MAQLSDRLTQVMAQRVGTAGTLEQRLRRLTELRDAGLISREEHDARRREILEEV
jgi:hypothetical protein